MGCFAVGIEADDDRAHGIGRRHPVTVYRLVAKEYGGNGVWEYAVEVVIGHDHRFDNHAFRQSCVSAIM